MFFIQPTADTVQDALSSWSWLDIQDKTPFAVTVMGDVFLEADDGIWFLDRIEGKLTLAAVDHERLEQILDTEEGQDHYLWYALVEAAQVAGMVPDDNECYDFKVAPILGGDTTLENLELRAFDLVLNIAGQVHEQVKDVPAGTAVNQVVVNQ